MCAGDQGGYTFEDTVRLVESVPVFAAAFALTPKRGATKESWTSERRVRSSHSAPSYQEGAARAKFRSSVLAWKTIRKWPGLGPPPQRSASEQMKLKNAGIRLFRGESLGSGGPQAPQSPLLVRLRTNGERKRLSSLVLTASRLSRERHMSAK